MKKMQFGETSCSPGYNRYWLYFFFSLALFYFIFQLTSLSCGFNGHLLNLQCHFFLCAVAYSLICLLIDLSLYLFCCIRCWKCVTSIDSSVWCQCTVRCVHFYVYLKVSSSFCAIQACCLCCLTKFTTVFGFMYWFHIPF